MASSPKHPKSERDARSKASVAELLIALAEDATRERISLGDVVHAMSDRALAVLLLLFALPNAVPALPGTSGVLGLPLMFLALQLARGRPAWLPAPLARRTLPRAEFAAAVHRMAPWLERAELLLRPRLAPLTGRVGTRWVGGLCLLLATVLSLPIPLGNMLPALAICVLALGLLEGDGVWVLCGTCIAVGAVALASGVVYGLARAVGEAFGQALT